MYKAENKEEDELTIMITKHEERWLIESYSYVKNSSGEAKLEILPLTPYQIQLIWIKLWQMGVL